MGAGTPASRTSITLFSAATRRTASLSPMVCATLACLEICRSTASRSASASSVLMVSMSETGSTLPATWITLGSSKQRTTWAMASVSRILARNLLPSPSPFEAPATSPAMSTNSTTAGTTFCGCSIPAMPSRRVVEPRLDGRAVFRRRLLQHVVGALGSRWRLAHAQAQAPVLMGAQALRDVLQAVVAGDAAALLQARRAGRKVEFIVHHQDFLRLDLEEPGDHLHRIPAGIHEALRQQQPRRGGVVAADQRLELRVLAQRHPGRGGQPFDQPETRVVARALVLLARIAEPDNEADHRLLLVFLVALVGGRLGGAPVARGSRLWAPPFPSPFAPPCAPFPPFALP